MKGKKIPYWTVKNKWGTIFSYWSREKAKQLHESNPLLFDPPEKHLISQEDYYRLSVYERSENE